MPHRLLATFFIALLLVLGVVVTIGTRPPDPAPATAAADAFSAERATTQLTPLVTAPHPAGSPANAKVRDHLVERLRALGLAPATRTAVAARGHDDMLNVAATVTNVHAVIPGTKPTGRIILMAHYDSVANGPGAADDGANVASILEIVRALRTGPPLRNDVEVLLTDGEETGLLGAQAFVDSEKLDPARTVAVNLEARGSSGPALMYQSIGGNAGLLPAVGRSDALATSVFEDIYEMLPNDTDLTVFGEHGTRGLNFAFIDDSANYHTPQDDLAHLSHASVQAMGDAALGVVRELGGTDLGTLTDRDDTYFTVLGLVVHYPTWLVIPLAVIAFALVAFAVLRGKGRPGRVFLVAFSFVLPMAAAALGGWILWLLLRVLRPEYGLFEAGDTYHPLWYEYAAVLALLAFGLVWYRSLRRWVSAVEVTLGVLMWFALLGVAAAVLLPGASYLFMWPALAGAITMTAVRSETAHTPAVAVAIGVPLALLGLPQALLLFPLLGVSLTAVPLVVVAVLAAPLLALLTVAIPPRALSWSMAGLVVIGVGLAVTGLTVESYDRETPRPTSLAYGLDADTGKAYWFTTGEPDDPTMGSTFARQVPPPDFPVLAPLQVTAAPAAPASVAAPEVETLGTRTNPDGSHTAHLRVRATAHAIYLHGTGQVLGATLNGAPVRGGRNVEGKWWGAVYSAPPPEGVDLTITARGEVRLTITADNTGLPEGAPKLPPDATWVPMSPVANQTFAQRTTTI